MDFALVEKIAAEIDEGKGRLLRSRQAKETMRRVFRIGDYVVKTFEIVPATCTRFRRPWEIESRALQRLGSDYTGIFVGVLEKSNASSRVFYFVKKFVPGVTLDSFSLADMPDVAREMAFFHSRGIITDDANVGNFIRDPSGRILFLDFGRAKIYSEGRAPAHAVGKELAKLFREGCGYDYGLWNIFLPEYYKFSEAGWWRRTRIEFHWRLAKFFRDIRKGKNR